MSTPQTQLQTIQDAIRKRFKVPLETGMGTPVYMEGDGRISGPGPPQSGDRNAPPVNLRQAAFSAPQGAVITPVQEPNQQPTVPVSPAGQQIPAGMQSDPFATRSRATQPEFSDPRATRPRYSGAAMPIDETTGQPATGSAKMEAELNAMRSAPRGREIQEAGGRIGYSATPPHRSFRQILKEGLEGAAVAGQANPNNPYAMIGGFGVGAGSGGVQPNIVNREFQERKTEGQLQRALAEQGQKAQIQALQYRPYYQQQQLDLAGGRLNETRRRNDAYVSHLESLPKEKQAEGARKMWMSGVADGNPELKAELQRRMGLKEELPDSDKGTIETDAAGNFTVVHGRTGTAKPVTQTTTTAEGQSTQAPVTSFAKTKADTQQKQFEAREKRIREVAALSRDAAMERAKVLAGATASRLGDPDELGAVADRLDDEASNTPNTASGRHLKGQLGSLSTRLREQASKARRAQTYQGPSQGAQSSGRQFNESAFKDAFQKKHGRTPTDAEIAPYRNAQPQ